MIARQHNGERLRPQEGQIEFAARQVIGKQR